MQIFISHSSVDAERAANICEILERNGTKCFIAPRDIRSGREYAEELVNGIDNSSALILLMSDHANHSPHVLREVERAVSRSIPILVYKLEEVALSKSMEYFLMTHQWVSAQSDENCVDILRFVEDLQKQETLAKAPSTLAGGRADSLGNKCCRDSFSKDSSKGAGTVKNSSGKPKFFKTSAVILALFLLVAGISAAIHNSRNSIVNTITVGDTLTFGRYNGTPIEWRVLKLSDDKNMPF